MTLELSAIPLAFLAGVLSVVSPCVWPLIPIVMGSAGRDNKLSGPISLALGLSISFALAGTLLSFILVSTSTDPEFFRYIAAVLLIVIALPMLFTPLGDRVSFFLSRFTQRFQPSGDKGSRYGQFGVGFLLGLVWLPCVGPTLGAAIALASIGQDFFKAFLVMFAFGVGTAGVLVAAALASSSVLSKMNANFMTAAGSGKKIFACILILMGALVLTGGDKLLEAWALSWMPDWSTEL